MSKAFTREDDLDDASPPPRPVAILPPGARNYLTAAGALRLQADLTQLLETERPPLLARPEDTDAKRALQALDRRIQHLQASLRSAEVVTPPAPPHEIVRFGATVTVRDQAGESATYRIVGVDETDFDRGWVSWLSPIARALLNARLGQRVSFPTPRGRTELEIIAIAYD